MCFTFKKSNKQTKKPVNCFLQDDASAGMQSVTSYQLITLNEIMALISSSTEENTEFEVLNYFFSV